MVSLIAKHYDYIIRDLADPRVDGWPLMGGPWSALAICAVYLYLVYFFLPNFMSDRKPYKLKTILRLYNVFQIVACAVLIYGVATSGWTTHYSLGCQPIDYSDDELAVRMLRFVWWTFMLKLAELVETVFFVLRKKQNQVTKLHVYHHVSTFMFGWLTCKYIGGGMATFPVLINSFVHILMYTYYLLASFGPGIQRRLRPWKPKLTILQMVQFFVLIAHSMQSLAPSCNVPKQLLLLWVPNIVTIFLMFYDFYKESYLRKRRKVA